MPSMYFCRMYGTPILIVCAIVIIIIIVVIIVIIIIVSSSYVVFITYESSGGHCGAPIDCIWIRWCTLWTCTYTGNRPSVYPNDMVLGLDIHNIPVLTYISLTYTYTSLQIFTLSYKTIYYHTNITLSIVPLVPLLLPCPTPTPVSTSTCDIKRGDIGWKEKSRQRVWIGTVSFGPRTFASLCKVVIILVYIPSLQS